MSFMLTLVSTTGVMLLPVALVFKLSKSRYWPQLIYIFGVAYIFLYGVCVAVPYHLQGYSELVAFETTEPLGLTKLLPVSFFAYMFTFANAGYSWTATAMCMVAVGNLRKHIWYETVLKIASIFLGALYLFHMTNYESTINYVLE